MLMSFDANQRRLPYAGQLTSAFMRWRSFAARAGVSYRLFVLAADQSVPRYVCEAIGCGSTNRRCK